ncbi:MAG: fibrillarin-like rRNA/tRNA 2'-O-methyltransferase, partial [Methanosarcinaceae archaeon]|nr:fibrillarin-like rRNA/tRNA 2'-O-methyltransferase [Methanosarcinaceae archaeon]
NPKNVFKNEIRKLEHEFDVGFEVLDSRELMPFHEDHLGVMARVLRVRK